MERDSLMHSQRNVTTPSDCVVVPRSMDGGRMCSEPDGAGVIESVLVLFASVTFDATCQ